MDNPIPMTRAELDEVEQWGKMQPLLPLGEILRNIRRRANVSQRELVNDSGMTFKEVCGIENGRIVPDTVQLMAWALCMQQDADLLLLAAVGDAALRIAHWAGSRGQTSTDCRRGGRWKKRN